MTEDCDRRKQHWEWNLTKIILFEAGLMPCLYVDEL